MYNKIIEFLKSNKIQDEITINKNGENNTLIIIKYYYDDNNIILYTQLNDDDLDISKNIEYSGIYNIKTNTFYDISYTLRCIMALQNVPSCFELEDTINSLVLKKCREIIKKDFKNIYALKYKIELSDWDKKDIERHKNYYARKTAQRYFLEGKTIDDIDIRIKNIPEISFKHIIDYINNNELLINEIAQQHINNNLKYIYLNSLFTEMYKKEFLEIQNDKTNILHLQKSIKESITGQKTVNVTIFKDNKEFTFKTGTVALKLCSMIDYYSPYYIVAKDRKKFYELFGESADYTADEIVKITYGKKNIYVKEVA